MDQGIHSQILALKKKSLKNQWQMSEECRRQSHGLCFICDDCIHDCLAHGQTTQSGGRLPNCGPRDTLVSWCLLRKGRGIDPQDLLVLASASPHPTSRISGLQESLSPSLRPMQGKHQHGRRQSLLILGCRINTQPLKEQKKTKHVFLKCSIDPN